MEKTPKKDAGKDAAKACHKPVLSPKPNVKKTAKENTTKTKQDNTHDKKLDRENNSDEIFVKRERSLSDGSVKSLSWVASEPIDEDSPSHMPATRTRSNTTNKEMWTPLARNEKASKPKVKEGAKAVKALSPEPVKPPRPKVKRNAKEEKHEAQSKHRTKSKSKVDTSRTRMDPIKPPRRKLPQAPQKDSPEEERQKGKTSNSQKDVELQDVISQPVVTSTSFQENMMLSVEDLDEDGSGRRMFSIYDDNTESTLIQQGQSFYDFLYSKEDLGTSQAGALSGSHIKDLGDDNIYDEVPLESSTQSLASLGKRGSINGFEIYDEVIISKEIYMMPVDNTDDLSDWGSDFDDDDDDFDIIEVDDIDVRYNKHDDNVDEDDGGSDSGSGSYEEYKNSSAMYYAEESSTPPPRRKPALKLRNDSGAAGKKVNLHVNLPGLKGIKGCFGMNRAQSLEYLASPKSNKDVKASPKSNKDVKEQEDEPDYVDPNIADTENYQQPVMPDMAQGLSSVQIKRHQIVKFILESESDYMKLLDRLIKQYELPIRERDLLEPSKIDIIFQGIHKVLDCHVMFNIALSGRMDEWNTEEKIGDILYALFSKSMVLEAYSSYVNNFAKAMDTVKTACKTHLAFTQLLKARRQACRQRTTLHTLMLKPTKRFPQFIDLVQELLKVTPIEHPDRIPLQMALTQLEYLADNLYERKHEAELRQKVKQLDASTAHISKPLSSGSRYFIRQDDFVQCVIDDDTIVRTKKQRIIMLSDMLVCVSAIKGKKDRMANLITDVKAKYKLKWNVPLCDVEVIEYGPGINMYASPPKTNMTQVKQGQYGKHTGCQEHFADLQHDLAVIGQIAGLVSTLRRSYQILDTDKVHKWHKAIQRTIEEESRLANMYWLELSLPAKTGRVNYIFSTDSPSVKAEWLTALNTAILRLAPENNPGWYLPEDNGTGEVAIQRRNMPLLKDNIDLFLLNPKARVQGIVTCPDVTNPLPGIHDNYNNLWLLCGGPDSTGFVNVIRVSCASPPQIIESFHVCDSQILCGEFVERTCLEDKKVTGPLSGKFGFPFPTVWIGTQSGKIYIHNGIDSERRYVMSVKLPDSVFALKAVKRKVFASLGDGSVVVFRPNKDGIWDFSKPKAIGLSKLPVTCIALVAGSLWCGSGNNIHVFDPKKEIVKHVIEVDSNPKTTVHHLVCYGIGVWVSLWKQPTIKLYHSETMEHVQDMNIAYTVNTMQNDIDSQFEKTRLSKLYVSCMAAEEGVLWVGTNIGLVLIFPLPRLEGIPLVSGRACVSFHAYQGRVRCLCPLMNNPEAEIKIGPASDKKKRYQLFREHVMRDACVQTDAKISGFGSYASNGTDSARRASMPNARPRNNKQEGEDDDDDDVHSDEEFNFVDEKQNYIHPSGTAPNTSPNLSVRIGSTGEGSNIGNSTLANQIPELGDTDFVRMMEDFQGFGSLAKTSIPDLPDVSAVLITKGVPNELNENEKTGDDKSTPVKQSENKLDKIKDFSDTTQGEDLQGKVGGALVSPNGNADTANYRGRTESQGQYVKLEDAQKEAKAIGESLDAAMKQSNGSDVKEENTDDFQPGNDVTPGSLPSYVSLVNSTLNTTRVFESDSDNEATGNKDASYTVFSESNSGEVQSPESGDKKKVANLKPRLPFPVLLVTAGEGHSDLRRKKQDSKNTDPRIMIWQIN